MTDTVAVFIDPTSANEKAVIAYSVTLPGVGWDRDAAERLGRERLWERFRGDGRGSAAIRPRALELDEIRETTERKEDA